MKLLILFTLSLNAFAIKLSDYSPFEYNVFFTNPECKEYRYDTPIKAIDGSLLEAKPKNVYCTRADASRNKKRENSPHFQIKKVISSTKTKEIFLTYLSFSNSDIANTLCDNMKSRGLKVTFIIDNKNKERADQGATANFEKVKACGATTYYRGGTGSNKDKLGYAHNKVIITNPSGKYGNETTIVFSSGNMSSGTHMHHENWHFVKTNLKSYFAQKHLCLMDGMIDYGKTVSSYSKYLKSCISKIKTTEEEDIRTYFVPGEGKEAIKNMVKQGKRSVGIDAAAHRITLSEFVNMLKGKAKAGYPVRFVVDDDVHWTHVTGEVVGSNMEFEYAKVKTLFTNGVDVRYMESNQGSRYLHHNKYIIFDFGGNEGAVHAGAGNFTRAAFTKNYENFYYIKMPAVVEAFKKQYEHMFNSLATPYSKLPVKHILP